MQKEDLRFSALLELARENILEALAKHGFNWLERKARKQRNSKALGEVRAPVHQLCRDASQLPLNRE